MYSVIINVLKNINFRVITWFSSLINTGGEKVFVIKNLDSDTCVDLNNCI